MLQRPHQAAPCRAADPHVPSRRAAKLLSGSRQVLAVPAQRAYALLDSLRGQDKGRSWGDGLCGLATEAWKSTAQPL
jgi:hypothetical protein